MDQRRPDRNELIISYMYLRKTVGWIGSLLPIVLLAGNAIFFGKPRPGSMSGYYYTDMRNVFVGALCALGVFLVAYDGYDEVDRWITNIAAATFIALALMALRFAKAERTPDGLGTISQVRHALGLARPSEGSRLRKNNWDDVVYRFCGFTIIGSVVLAALSNLLPASVKANWPSLFVFEALAVFAFGVSWFVKGRTMGVLALRASRAAASLLQIRPGHESHRPAAN